MSEVSGGVIAENTNAAKEPAAAQVAVPDVLVASASPDGKGPAAQPTRPSRRGFLRLASLGGLGLAWYKLIEPFTHKSSAPVSVPEAATVSSQPVVAEAGFQAKSIETVPVKQPAVVIPSTAKQ